MNKKTIVMVLPDLKGNGAERLAMTLADGLIDKGHNTHIILFKNFIELKSRKKIPIHIFNYHFRWIPKSIRAFFVAPLLDLFIRKICGNPDLVLSFLLPVDRILCESRLNNVFLSIVNTPSYDFFQHLSGKLLKKEISRLSKIYTKKPSISITKDVKKDFDSFFKNEKNSHQIYGPIDVQFLENLSNSAMQHQALSNYIVHVAKFKEQKRHDILIKAYAKSSIEEKLVLLGQGPLEKQSRDLVKRLNIEDKVIFAGFQSNPYPYMKNAKFMVLSSEFEGLGIVILDSITLGTPVISTDCDSGPREILPEENLVPINDVNALANKISAVSDNTANYSCNIRKEFLLENVVKEYIKLIN